MTPRWPLEPLAALVGGRSGMMRLGFDSGELGRANRDGLSDRLADRWAVRCHLHPGEVWADWFDIKVAA